MRGYSIVLTPVVLAPLLALAACGGSGPESAGSLAPSTPGGTGSGGGSGGGVGATPSPSPTPGTTPTSFLKVATETTFNAVGASHSFGYAYADSGATSVLYQGNASTVRTPTGTVTYNPRDGIFSIALTDDKAGVARTVRFQDPAHREDFDPTSQPWLEAPNLPGFNYLTAGDARNTTTFFYQRPDSTLYVSLAGFSYVGRDDQDRVIKRERGVVAFGQQTIQSQIPQSGTGSYTGGFLASAVLNSALGSGTSYMQWIAGASTIDVDFGRSTVALGFTGTVRPTYWNGQLVDDATLRYGTGTVFNATATATIDLVRTGGFSGVFGAATLGADSLRFDPVSSGSSIAGGNSLDGGFFGPNAVNVGGNFRIIGGVPDQRIDIQGAFTGAKR